ncbi:hypothetical protein WBP06_25050 [Novosphingobium sp. BL-8H]|uniref:hypothetical protein n=1 Tax=Novosphingobium sp. BL-8H TaxID=3127640 RepID=UPI003756D06E
MPEDADRYYNDFFGRLVAFVAIIAFSIQPILDFIDPGLFLMSSGALALGVIVLSRIFRGSTSNFDRLLAFVGVLGALSVTYSLIGAMAVAGRNDARCAKIEMDMLSAHPKMTNGPDVFQALKCRPQTDADAERLKPTSAPQSAPKPKPKTIATPVKPSDAKPESQTARSMTSAPSHGKP